MATNQHFFEVEKGYKLGAVVWLSGAGVPAGADATAAAIGSFWTDETNGTMYRKEATGWEAQASQDYVDAAIAGIVIPADDDANIQAFIGKGADGVEMPVFTENNAIATGDSLELAIDKLDIALQLTATAVEDLTFNDILGVTASGSAMVIAQRNVADVIANTTPIFADIHFDIIIDDTVANMSKDTYSLIWSYGNFDYVKHTKLKIGVGVSYTISFNYNVTNKTIEATVTSVGNTIYMKRISSFLV
ncbi:MAG: hypothetical protein QG564_1826 [Campylobacterota bacterium]|nr:hypothetical protein [Campylobacterota bacterium]